MKSYNTLAWGGQRYRIEVVELAVTAKIGVGSETVELAVPGQDRNCLVNVALAVPGQGLKCFFEDANKRYHRPINQFLGGN